MSLHSIVVQWSEEDGGYIARVPELPGLSAFGATPEKAVKELGHAKGAYLEVMKEDGEEIPEPDVCRPFSGQTRLRLPKSLHASLTHEAKSEGVSFNTYVVNLLAERNALHKVKAEIRKGAAKSQSTIVMYHSPTAWPFQPEASYPAYVRNIRYKEPEMKH